LPAKNQHKPQKKDDQVLRGHCCRKLREPVLLAMVQGASAAIALGGRMQERLDPLHLVWLKVGPPISG
jgi:hypothetical protein